MPFGARPYGTRWRTWNRAQLEVIAKAAEVWMPVLPRYAPAHHGYGRRRLRDRSRVLVLYAAWLRDIRGVTYEGTARELGLDPQRGYDSAKKAAKRHILAGRALLHDEGVLPWLAWSKGELPLKWWKRPELHQKLRRWEEVGRLAHEEIVRASTYCAEVSLRGRSEVADEHKFKVPPWRLVGALQSPVKEQHASVDRGVYPYHEDPFPRLLRVLQARILYGTDGSRS
jgi:hypothetical protein